MHTNKQTASYMYKTMCEGYAKAITVGPSSWEIPLVFLGWKLDWPNGREVLLQNKVNQKSAFKPVGPSGR